MTIDAYRAQGGASGGISFGTSPGGDGAHATGTLPVTPGETLLVTVGGEGGNRGSEAGGFNGGGGNNRVGNASKVSGGGGGASDVRVAPYGLSDREIVAAGGGGAGGNGAGSGPGGEGGVAGGDGGASDAAGDPGTGVAGGGAGGGGGPGTGTSGGTAGGAGLGDSNGGAGAVGVVGQGGASGVGSGFGGDGGGGGGGYYGGGSGGGAGGTFTTDTGGGGGGGGGGSSFVDPVATSVTVSDGVQAGDGQVTVTYPIPTDSPGSGSLGFTGTQPQSTTSAPQTLTIDNNGSAPLIVSGLSFTGADPGDFLVVSSTCGGQVPAGSSCQVGVDFAPQGQGPRTATLDIASNVPTATVTLSGTGGELPTGATGATGANGAKGNTGATGLTGPRGPAGKVEVITCTTIPGKKNVKRGKPTATHQKCTGRLLSGTLKFTAAERVRATISRGPITYATGTIVSNGQGRSRLVVLIDRQVIRNGSYTLTVRTRHGRHWSTRSATITIA